MTENNPDQITGTISITVLPQTNGQYVCQLSTSLSNHPICDIRCYGQTQEHAIAIVLEQLADEYRRMAEEGERFFSGEMGTHSAVRLPNARF